MVVRGVGAIDPVEVGMTLHSPSPVVSVKGGVESVTEEMEGTTVVDDSECPKRDVDFFPLPDVWEERGASSRTVRLALFCVDFTYSRQMVDKQNSQRCLKAWVQ